MAGAVRVIMIMPAFAARLAKKIDSGLATCEEVFHRIERIALFSPDGRDAARRHMLGKSGAEACGQDDLDAINGMWPGPTEFVDDHFFGQRQALNFNRLAVRPHLKN
jgi:hypothetical protein